MRKILYSIKILFCYLFIVGCAPKFIYSPEPEKDVKEWVKNLSRQKSFSYKYQLKTAGAKISAQGDCIIGQAEHITGLWDYGDTITGFEYIGINDREWSKKDGKWLESIRGEESNLFAQIQRVLEFERYELLNVGDRFLFRFNAVLPFLAPEKWREMVGYIGISRKLYLPEFIWVGLPDSSVYWQVEITNYNHKRIIKSPHTEFLSYQIIPDGSLEYNFAIKKIKGRLKALKLNWTVKRDGEKIILNVPRDWDLYDIKEFLAPGVTFICGVTKNGNQASRIAYFKGNVNQSVFLTDLRYGHDKIKSVDLKFDHINRPFLTIKLKQKIEPVEQIAIEIDSFIIATVELDKDKKINKISAYPDMKYLDLLKIKAFIAQPLFKMEVLPLAKGSY